MRLLGSALVLLAITPAIAGAAPSTGREVLADPAFGFCHDPAYPLTEEEAQWCPLVPTDDPPCPAFRAACKAPRALIEGELGPLGTRTPGEGTPDARDGEKEPEPEPPERTPTDHDRRTQSEPELEVPSAGPLPHVLVWIIVAVMVVAVLWQLRGPAGTKRVPTDEAAPDGPAPPETEAEPELGPRETDADRLLARATRRAEQGELAGAVADGHAALLRRLAERGHVRLHPSRTNGDHVRDLRAEPVLHEPARQVMRIVERVQFGHAPVARAEVDRLLAEVRSVLTTLAGALLLVWTSLACSGDSAKEYPWSHSPSGHAGVLALLRANGITVEYRTASLEGLRRDGPTPIVLDGAGLTAPEETELVSHVRRGGRVVWASREPLPHELRFAPRRPNPMPLGPRVVAELSQPVSVPGSEGRPRSDIDGPASPDVDGAPYALAREVGQGFAVVLADDHLFTNAALAVPENDVFLVDLLRAMGGSFELVDGHLRELAGDGGASDPFDAIARAELTPVIGQLLLLVLLLYLWRGVHFGRPRDPPPPSRRRFVEHVEALARQYERAGARRHALHLYAGWALERVQERFGGQRRGLHHLAGRIAARTGRDETEIMRTLVEAHHARDDVHDGHGAAEDLQVLRELGRLIDSTTAQRPAPRPTRGSKA